MVDRYPKLVNKTTCRHAHTPIHAHTHTNSHKHTHKHTRTHTHINADTHTHMYKRSFLSPASTHRGRGDTYCKLVKPLKTPSGTLVS